MQKIGKKLAVLWALTVFLGAVALADIRFSARVDQTHIQLGDTVTLQLSIESDGGGRAGQPQLNATDFAVVNEYNSYSMSSQYDSSSGKFSTVNTQQISKVLSPQKTGNLRISNIQIEVGGKVYKAPDIVVQVVAGGNSGSPQAQRGTPPSNGYHSGQSRQEQGSGIFVRADVNKEAAYKGEEIIVSYYLYHQARVFNLQVEKFPVLTGFLREDLEVPALGQRTETERVVLNGVPYERDLLARYAAFPLQEGTLTIDPLSLRCNYYSRQRGNGFDEDDPFFGFFQQMAPRVAAGKSEPITIKVKPLPTDGRPESFTGGIGDFSVTSAVDKYDVRANEAINLTVKIDGQGNVSSIQSPKHQWPNGVDLYDSKGQSQNGRGGGGERIFEFLLIPRVPGKLTLPPLEFGFFDPVKGKYYTKSTEPISLNVLEPAPGTSLVKPSQIPAENKAFSSGSSALQSKGDDLRFLKPPFGSESENMGIPLWRVLYWIFSLMALALISLMVWDYLQKTRGKEKNSGRIHSKSWERLRECALSATKGAPWNEVVHAYEGLAGLIFDALDRQFKVSSRSLSRAELRQVLVGEKGLQEPLWEKVSDILEFTEMVRFATSAGAVTEDKARTDLAKWVAEGENVTKALTVRSSK